MSHWIIIKVGSTSVVVPVTAYLEINYGFLQLLDYIPFSDSYLRTIFYTTLNFV